MNNLLNISIKTYNQQQNILAMILFLTFLSQNQKRIRIQIKEKFKKNYVEIYDVQQKKNKK